MRGKHFAVLGLGNFGSVVVSELLKLKCRVSAVDHDRGKLELLEKHSQLDAIVGDATDRTMLESLDMEQFDAVIISTGEDSHASILIAMHVHELGGKRIVVKANSEDHAKILALVGADKTVIPEQEMAVKLAHSFAQPNLVDYIPLSGDYIVAEIKAPPRLVNKKLMDLNLRREFGVQVIAIKSGDNGDINFAPGGQHMIKDGQRLLVLGTEENINKLRE